MGMLTALVVLAWIAIVLLALATGGLLRQLRDLQESQADVTPNRGGLRITDFAPIARRLDLPLGPKLVMLAREDCLTCRDLVPAFSMHGGDEAYERVVLYATRVPTYATQTGAATKGDTQWAFDEIGVRVTPSLMVVDAEDRIVVIGAVGSVATLNERLATVPQLIGERRFHDQPQ